MQTLGTAHFVNFTKACDYYKGHGYDECTPAELEKIVRTKIAEGDIYLGKPEVSVGERLILIDDNCRYALEID